TARKYNLRRISDLRHAPPLRVVVDLDFPDRADGWVGLVKAYGLDLPRPLPVSPDFRYRILEAGEADLVCGFATDWQSDALGLVVLEDDRGYFPSYHGAPLARGPALAEHPEIAAVLNRLHGRIDDQAMRRLNAQVARDRRPEAEVAREFLT